MSEIAIFTALLFGGAISSILSSSDKVTKILVFVTFCFIAYFSTPYLATIMECVIEHKS